MTDTEEERKAREEIRQQLIGLKPMNLDELVYCWERLDFPGMLIDYCIRVLTTVVEEGSPDDVMKEYGKLLEQVEAHAPRHMGLARINIQTYWQAMEGVLDVCPKVLDILSRKEVPYKKREQVARSFIMISTPLGGMLKEFSKAIARVVTHYSIPANELQSWIQETRLAIQHDHRVVEANEKIFIQNNFSNMADALVEGVTGLPASDAVALLFMSMMMEIGIRQRKDVLKNALQSIGEIIIRAEGVSPEFIERMKTNDLLGDTSMNSTSGFLDGEEVMHIESEGQVASDLADTLFAKVLGQKPGTKSKEGESHE
jgi:hypothetical protein